MRKRQQYSGTIQVIGILSKIKLKNGFSPVGIAGRWKSPNGSMIISRTVFLDI